MKEIARVMSEYRDITKGCISLVENDEFEKFEDMINIRGEIINELNLIEYSKEELSMICRELDIAEFDKELLDITAAKKNTLKKEMGQLNKNKAAYGAYNKQFTNSSYFVKRKI